MRTPRVKLVPPRLPASHIRRPVLEELLGEAERRRLTSIVAGPGFGKSTLVASVAAERHWAWYLVDGGDGSLSAFAQGLKDALDLSIPVAAFAGGGAGRARAESLAAALVRALEEALEQDVVLVVDDVHELGDGASAHLLESLVRQAPPELHLVLCSRKEPPFPIERLRGRGQVLDIDAASLSFSGEEVAGVVAELGVELAARIHELTEGWPAAVQLAGEMLQSIPEAEREQAVTALAHQGGPLVSYLAEEVLRAETAEARELLQVAALFDRFSADLCEAVGTPLSADVLGGLRRRGLVAANSGPGGWFSMHAVLRDFVLESLPLEETRVRDLQGRAAAWFESQELYREALAALRAAADAAGIERFFTNHWRELIDRGFSDAVVEAAETLSPALFDEHLELIGRSYALLGDLGRALECFSGMPLGPDRAFQLADIHMQRGELRQALDVLLWVLQDRKEEIHSLSLSYIAFIAPHLGELEIGREAARRALEVAEASGDLTHLADAHVGLADVARAAGDPKTTELHYRAGRELAGQGRNLLSLSAAQVKTARFWATCGLYQPALELVETAIETADGIGFSQMQTEGRIIRGAIYFSLGRLDEAAADFSAARAMNEAVGRLVDWPLAGLGDVYLARGELARARTLYDEALEQGKRSGQVALQVVASCGLARSLAGDDLERAAELAEEAVTLRGSEAATAHLTAGWIALRQGDRERAAEFAAAASAEARRRDARPSLAESLELQAFCAEEPNRARLEEARATWDELGAAVARARVDLVLARLSGAGSEAARAAHELQQLGVGATGSQAAGVLMALGLEQPAPLEIQTLGGFRVLTDGKQIPHEAWRSKKARDLLKILVARRGHSVSRDELIEALWPEEDPDRTGNRLSVALSTLRSVLDAGRNLPQSQFIAAGDGSVRILLETTSVDIEAFLTQAEAGLRAGREGRGEEAIALLEDSEAAYTGDFLEEDRYEDWAEPVRNEALATYIEVLRALADAAGESKYFRRIIERDRYDEHAHLGLVAALTAAGAHGEARRAYRTYVARLEEIGAEPAPFPEPTALSRA